MYNARNARLVYNSTANLRVYNFILTNYRANYIVIGPFQVFLFALLLHLGHTNEYFSETRLQKYSVSFFSWKNKKSFCKVLLEMCSNTSEKCVQYNNVTR